MSCPHSMIGSPEFCSQCRGVVVERRVLTTIPDENEDVFSFDFVEPAPRARREPSPALREIRAAAARVRWESAMSPEERASKILALHREGRTPKEIAGAVGCAVSTVYRIVGGS